MSLSSYAVSLLSNYNYMGILPASDLPTPQNYPGIQSITPTLLTWLSSASSLLEQSAQVSSFPSSLSYGAILTLAIQGQTLAQQLDSLSPAPILLCAEVWDVVYALQVLTIYPELVSS